MTTDYDEQLLEKKKLLDRSQIATEVKQMDLSDKYAVQPVEVTREENDNEFASIKITVPNTVHLRMVLQELVDFLNTQSFIDVGFFIQILDNAVYIELDYRLSEQTLADLDILTS